MCDDVARSGGDDLKLKLWVLFYLCAGLYGCVGEIIINTTFRLIRGFPLWVYYNGMDTSIESFFLFGLGGCIAFWLYSKVKERDE